MNTRGDQKVKKGRSTVGALKVSFRRCQKQLDN